MVHNGFSHPKWSLLLLLWFECIFKENILQHRYFMINFACKIPLIFVTFIFRDGKEVLLFFYG